MNPLARLFGRGQVGQRPNLREMLRCAATSDVLLVDGSTAPDGEDVLAEFDGATVVRADDGDERLPRHEHDSASLPAREGGWPAVLLLDVVDCVLDPVHALSAAAAALAPGGRLLLVQQVGPDDFDDRAAWNALMRMRDTTRTWTPSRRQARAMAGTVGFDKSAEVAWHATSKALGASREGLEPTLRLYAEALARDGVVISGDDLQFVRVALPLDRK